ncbi:hypothetical protein H0H92_004081, partial [Tricholoma furcatifolium]
MASMTTQGNDAALTSNEGSGSTDSTYRHLESQDDLEITVHDDREREDTSQIAPGHEGSTRDAGEMRIEDEDLIYPDLRKAHDAHEDLPPEGEDWEVENWQPATLEREDWDINWEQEGWHRVAFQREPWEEDDEDED